MYGREIFVLKASVSLQMKLQLALKDIYSWLGSAHVGVKKVMCMYIYRSI